MAGQLQIEFTALKEAGSRKGRGTGGTLVVLAGADLAMGAQTRRLLGATADVVKRAASTAKFKGNLGQTLDLLAPVGLELELGLLERSHLIGGELLGLQRLVHAVHVGRVEAEVLGDKRDSITRFIGAHFTIQRCTMVP